MKKKTKYSKEDKSLDKLMDLTFDKLLKIVKSGNNQDNIQNLLLLCT